MTEVSGQPDADDPIGRWLAEGDLPTVQRERDEARAEVERLTGLLSRIAGSACNYGSRVYRLTDDFAALRPYLTDEELANADERPSRADERLAAELDYTERALEQVNKASVRLEGRLKEQIRDLGDVVTQLTAESDEFEGQVDAVVALHQRRYWKWKSWRGFLQILADNPEAYCRECRKAWPCPTVQRLTEES